MPKTHGTPERPPAPPPTSTLTIARRSHAELSEAGARASPRSRSAIRRNGTRVRRSRPRIWDRRSFSFALHRCSQAATMSTTIDSPALSQTPTLEGADDERKSAALATSPSDALPSQPNKPAAGPPGPMQQDPSLILQGSTSVPFFSSFGAARRTPLISPPSQRNSRSSSRRCSLPCSSSPLINRSCPVS